MKSIPWQARLTLAVLILLAIGQVTQTSSVVAARLWDVHPLPIMQAGGEIEDEMVSMPSYETYVSVQNEGAGGNATVVLVAFQVFGDDFGNEIGRGSIIHVVCPHIGSQWDFL